MGIVERKWNGEPSFGVPLRWLEDVRSAHSGRSDFVVVTKAGTPFDHRGAARRLDTIVKRAGLDVEGEPRITPHQLRYSFGALLLDAAVPVAVVARMMGHANTSITQSIYDHEIKRRDDGERTRLAMREAFGPPAAAQAFSASRPGL
jgi:integrase